MNPPAQGRVGKRFAKYGDAPPLPDGRGSATLPSRARKQAVACHQILEPLASFEDRLAEMERAERGEGWLAWCEARGIFVAWNHELIEALAAVLGQHEVLEVAAGDGALAQHLAGAGVRARATDANPLAAGVEKLTVAEALARYSPEVALASFPPIDAGIEWLVTRHSAVRRFLYIGPLIHERVGPDALWREPGWERRAVPEVDRFLISRLDYLADFTRWTHRRRAGTLLLVR